MNNLWLKKCEKGELMSEKEKRRKGVFLINNRECFALSHFIFTTQNQIFVSVSSAAKNANVANYHNYIKHELGNPNFSSAFVAIPLFS